MNHVEENSVKFIRLSTGEDLISETTEVKENDSVMYYILHNPLKVVYYTGKQGTSLSISLIQWVFHRICENQNFVLYTNDIVTLGNPSESMENYYWDTVDHFSKFQSKIEKEPIEDHISEDAEKEAAEFLEELKDMIDMNKKRILH